MKFISNRNHFFGKLTLLVLVLAIATSDVYADCGSSINMKQGTSSSINMGNYLGYGNTPGNDLLYVPISNLLFGKSDSTFKKENMTSIFWVQGENNAPGYAMTSSTYNSKNIYNDYDCSYIYRAGTYIYGSISGLRFDMIVDGRYQDEYNWLGFRTEAHEKADGYAAAQIYYLSYSTDVTKLKSMMNDAYQYSININYDYSWRNRFVGNLLSQPYSYPLYMKLIEGGSVSESYNAHTGYGVYYLAVAGGLRNRNDEHWDEYSLNVNIKGGDYVVSPTILKTSQEVRNAFSNAGKLSLFESQSNMCALVGEHISTKGINPTSGTKCCGGSLNPDNDIGKTSLQYICRKDTSVTGGRYYWESICSKSASYESLPASEKTLYDTYCKCLGGSSECTCSGELKLSCSGTYSCSDLTQSECGIVNGCDWTPTYKMVCPTGDGTFYDQIKGNDIVGNDFNLLNTESFGGYETFTYPIDDGSGCYMVEDGGSCEPNGQSRSCSVISNTDCRDYNGCNLVDTNGGYHYSETESCLQYKDLTSCSVRQSCAWEPRKDAGGSCSQNSDCKAGLQCDPGFDSVITDCTDPAAKCYCHSTETACVVDSTGEEVAINGFKCSNKEYRQCTTTVGAYDKNSDGVGEFCTTTNGFTCTGSPSQTCIGSGSCYGLSRQSTCLNYDECTWNVAVEGPCYNKDYACSDPTQDTMAKGISPDGKYVINQESFGSIPVENFYIPPGSCGCTGLDQWSCEYNSADCYWYSQSAYCSGSVDCSDYSSGNCPSEVGCSPLTSCTELSYNSCSYGCERKCTVPKFNAPIDIHSDNNACFCYNGGTIKTCYYDGDGDNYPTSATASYCSTDGVNERIGNYICNKNNLDDCDDSDASITRTVYYRDADSDGYGNALISNTYCSLAAANAAGYVDNADDCNDGSATISPADLEICNNVDDNCDGFIDNANGVQTSNTLTQTGTCNTNGVCSGSVQTCTSGSWGGCSITPGPSEICGDGLDNDCNPSTVEAPATWYLDADNDGYGVSTTTLVQCTQPAGYVASSTDCDDSNSNIKPGATETCNNKDDNCDGYIDNQNGVLTSNTLRDTSTCDQDGICSGSYKTCNAGTLSATCSVMPGTEICGNSLDDDCDVGVDEALVWYKNSDGDNYYVTSTQCASPGAGYGLIPVAPFAGDCNDNNVVIYPGATELCDNLDNDCDSPVVIDEDVTPITGTCSQLGKCSGATQSCSAGSWGICSILPSTETCNSIDDNCDGTIDNIVSGGNTCYADFDNDGYGTGFRPTIQSCSSTTTLVNGNTYLCYNTVGDCNDDDATLTGLVTCYADLDNDNYANVSKTASLCVVSTPNTVATGPDGKYICNYNGVDDCDDNDMNVASDCACKGYVTYYSRIGFSPLESPNFKVISKPTVIDSICTANSLSPADVKFNVALTAGATSYDVAMPTPLWRPLNVPPCIDSVSANQYCKELGFGFTSVGVVTASTSGTCARYSGSSWAVSSTSSRITGMTCRYTSLLASDKVVFNRVDPYDGSFKPMVLNCTSSRFAGVTTNGPDGVCIDDFSAVALCGFDANGFPIDPDCGVHTFMTHGITRLGDNAIVTINPSVPNPVPHKACGTAGVNDCVTNIGGQLRCTTPGSLVYVGKDQDNQDKNITCSDQKTWCFDGYAFQGGLCESVLNPDCYIKDCPALANFKQLPDDSVKVQSNIYSFTNDDCTSVVNGQLVECSVATEEDLGITSSTYTITNPYGSTCTCDSSGTCSCPTTGSCIGPREEVCDIKGTDGTTIIGKGIKVRDCRDGIWTEYSQCRAKYCDKYYSLDRDTCVFSSTAICAGGSTSTSGTIDGGQTYGPYYGKLPCNLPEKYAVGEKNIVCSSSTSFKWSASNSECIIKGCYFGYEYRDGYCVPKTQSSGTYTYSIKPPVYQEKLVVSYNMSEFINDPECTVRIGSKINGVCVASQTYPEYKYTIENVIVK